MVYSAKLFAVWYMVLVLLTYVHTHVELPLYFCSKHLDINFMVLSAASHFVGGVSLYLIHEHICLHVQILDHKGYIPHEIRRPTPSRIEGMFS